MRRLLYAAYFFEVGLLLVVLPWTTFWDHNYLFEASGYLHALAENHYVRGAVSGLGLWNLAIGFAEVAATVGDRLRGAEADLARPTHAR